MECGRRLLECWELYEVKFLPALMAAMLPHYWGVLLLYRARVKPPEEANAAVLKPTVLVHWATLMSEACSSLLIVYGERSKYTKTMLPSCSSSYLTLHKHESAGCLLNRFPSPITFWDTYILESSSRHSTKSLCPQLCRF